MLINKNTFTERRGAYWKEGAQSKIHRTDHKFQRIRVLTPPNRRELASIRVQTSRIRNRIASMRVQTSRTRGKFASIRVYTQCIRHEFVSIQVLNPSIRHKGADVVYGGAVVQWLGCWVCMRLPRVQFPF